MRRVFGVGVAVLLLAGCGGSSPAKTAPPFSQVNHAILAIDTACINASYAGPNASPLAATQGTDALIRMTHRYSLTAPMHGYSGKIVTLRTALGDAAAFLQHCSPTDAARVNAILSH